jgi:hypothetical protein
MTSALQRHSILALSLAIGLVNFNSQALAATPNLPSCSKDATVSVDPFAEEQWFQDVVELSGHWLFEKADLPREKLSFCSEVEANAISARMRINGKFAEDDTFAFVNPPGPYNTGLCWFHSRLQRQFTYLGNYRPELPKPSKDEAKRIIERIKNREAVTEIPGYQNLKEFSAEYAAELEAALVDMAHACFFGMTLLDSQDCFARVGDDFRPTPRKLQSTLDRLAERTLASPGDIQLLRTRPQEAAWSDLPDSVNQIFNPNAHSFLLVDMEPLRAGDAPSSQDIINEEYVVGRNSSGKIITQVTTLYSDGRALIQSIDRNSQVAAGASRENQKLFRDAGVKATQTPGASQESSTSLPGRKTGYRLKVIDPNFPEHVQEVTYHYGDGSISVLGKPTIPYDHYEYQGDLPEMKKLLKEYCRP